MGRFSRRLAVPFLEFSGVPSRGRVLDAGCGTGSLTLELAASPGLTAIEAMDLEENFVASLRGRSSDRRIRARQGDAGALPYGDEEFDGVYSLLVLHFVSDPHRAVRKMRRVLRPGAIAAATAEDPHGVRQLRRLLAPHGLRTGSFGGTFDALPEARRDRIRDAVRQAYLAGDGDGPRGFESAARAVRGTA